MSARIAAVALLCGGGGRRTAGVHPAIKKMKVDPLRRYIYTAAAHRKVDR